MNNTESFEQINNSNAAARQERDCIDYIEYLYRYKTRMVFVATCSVHLIQD